MAESGNLRAQAGCGQTPRFQARPCLYTPVNWQRPTSSGPQFPHLKAMGLDPLALSPSDLCLRKAKAPVLFRPLPQPGSLPGCLWGEQVLLGRGHKEALEPMPQSYSEFCGSLFLLEGLMKPGLQREGLDWQSCLLSHQRCDGPWGRLGGSCLGLLGIRSHWLLPLPRHSPQSSWLHLQSPESPCSV